MVVFPIVSTLLALSCAIAVLLDYRARPKPDKVAWGLAFAIFAAAAGSEVIGSLHGWTPMLARTYYVMGATLVVGYLAVGELFLLLPRTWADRAAGLMAFLTVLAVALVDRSPVATNIDQVGWEALERGRGLTVLTVSINSIGTLILVGGLIWSTVRLRRLGTMRNRTIGCLLIAIGTLAVASGGILTRFGSHEFLYIAMSVGIALIFAGYLRARRPESRPSTVPRQERVEASATAS